MHVGGRSIPKKILLRVVNRVKLKRKLNIVSVSTLWPTEERPEFGIFIKRRLEAMAEYADLRVLKPCPWFPVLKPFRNGAIPLQTQTVPSPVSCRRMFYIPKYLKHFDGKWLERSIEKTIRRWHREKPIDVIDAHFGFPEGVGCVTVAKKLGIPVFVTIRGLETDLFHSHIIAKNLVSCLSECANVLSVSESLKRSAVKAGVPSEKIVVIPNGVDNVLYRIANKKDIRNKLGISLDSKIIVSVGNLKHVKGHDVLIRAFHEVAKTDHAAKLVLVGGEKQEPANARHLRKLVDALGLVQRVVFQGAVDPADVIKWLQAADVFSLASRREGCCNAMLEALACGVPVVTTDVGDNSHFINPLLNGFIVGVGDVQGLSAGIKTSFEKTWDTHAIADSVSQLTWKQTAARVLEEFTNVISRTSAIG